MTRTRPRPRQPPSDLSAQVNVVNIHVVSMTSAFNLEQLCHAIVSTHIAYRIWVVKPQRGSRTFPVCFNALCADSLLSFRGASPLFRLHSLNCIVYRFFAMSCSLLGVKLAVSATGWGWYKKLICRFLLRISKQFTSCHTESASFFVIPHSKKSFVD